MTLGVVTNCWRMQLAEGAELTSLIATARESGYRAIELRQTCLGEFESPTTRLPDPQTMSRLAELFPEMELNVAVAVPFMRGSVDWSDGTFLAGVEAAVAVAGQSAPHVRLVDLITDEARLRNVSAEQLADCLVELAEPLIREDGLLSVENALQPWGLLLDAFQRARSLLGDRSRHLRLCYDACNLLLAPDRPAPDAAVNSLESEMLSMVHVKQAKRGIPSQTVDDGDIDWSAQWSALRQMDYRGPVLFEIEPSDDIWNNLRRAREYLHRFVDTSSG